MTGPYAIVAGRAATLLTDDDLFLFNEGTHLHLYEKLGAHPGTREGREGSYFAVWAPDAYSVSVIGDFNVWDPTAHILGSLGDSGIWSGFIEGVGPRALYKYRIASRYNGYVAEKADPYAFRTETPPLTASVVAAPSREWTDAAWLASRTRKQSRSAPVSVYEVHLGSWRRVPEEGNRHLSYREIAAPLADYVKALGYTHVEFMPLTEHPFYGSWGYQTTGYFAPTSRYGTPEDLMYLIDYLHGQGIGVILDWVPAHFPTDAHGLGYFDGSHLYEHAYREKGFHPDWQSFIFNYGRNEVRSFLLSSALFWLDRYHVDGLRVDGVASMLYLDYSRKPGEWMPNEYGGRENLEAIDFLQRLNQATHREYPDTITVAEESTAWPMVSRPVYMGGLGFDYKWDMGWMHDTLAYFSLDPIYRQHHQDELTFRLIYAFNENFVLPLSHDEVVHGKGSLLDKLPGDDWQKFANLRLLYAYMYSQPGKKLLFMGDDFGQWREWNHDQSLDWHLAQYDRHQGIQRLVTDLNRLYREEPALHALDCDPAGFQWIDAANYRDSVLVYLRRAPEPAPAPLTPTTPTGVSPLDSAPTPGRDPFTQGQTSLPMAPARADKAAGEREAVAPEVVLVVCNFTPVPRYNYRVGVPFAGRWQELLNSDARDYDGSGVGNFGGVETSPIPYQGQPHSLLLTLPPLAAVFLKPEPPSDNE